MKQITFTLRTLTPLFLAGADQTNAELRAPTFRGLMRYWYRALIGGIVGTDIEGLKTVTEQEMKVFGATDKGSGITIRTSTDKITTVEFRREGTKWNGTGKDYLFWSMGLFGDKPRRRYIPQGIEFQVILSTRGNDETSFKHALVAFWLLTHLGGIGSRSRRCAGSIAILPTKGSIENLPFGEPVSIEALQDHLKQGIDIARSLYTSKHKYLNNASFDIIARDTCCIWILHNDGKPWYSADEAMNTIGLSLQDYRRSINPLWKRKIFGLPLKNVSGERWASPLLLRITKLQGEQYVGIAVLFKTVRKGIHPSAYKLVEDWIKAFSGRCEVRI